MLININVPGKIPQTVKNIFISMSQPQPLAAITPKGGNNKESIIKRK
jgi:hypothetical protein